VLELLRQILDQAAAMRAALDRFALATSSSAQIGLAPYGPETLLTMRELDHYLGIAHGRGRPWAASLNLIRATPAGDRVRLGDVVAALPLSVPVEAVVPQLKPATSAPRPARSILDALDDPPVRAPARAPRAGVARRAP